MKVKIEFILILLALATIVLLPYAGNSSSRHMAWLVEPQFEEVSSFSEGMAAVKKSVRWGYINIEGKVSVDFIFDDAWSFSEGLAKVKKNGRILYIDKDGKTVIDSGFQKSWRFSDGLARFEQKGKYGYFDKSGKIIISPMFAENRTAMFRQ